MFRSLCLVAGLLACVVGCSEKTPLEQKAPPEITVTIAGYDAIAEHIAKQKGKVTVVDLWSTSCAPCIKEFPGLVGLHNRFGADRVSCISVNLDYYKAKGAPEPDDLRMEASRFLKKQNARFTNFLSDEDSEEVLKKFGVPSMPIVFVYDREGKQAAKFGPEDFTYKEVTAKVEQVLDAK